MFVEVQDQKSGNWDFVCPKVNRRMYDGKKKEVKVPFFEGRNHELFEILQGEEDFFTPHYNLPRDMSDEISAEYREDFEPKDDQYTGCFDFRWASMKDIYISMLETPLIKNYDVEWEDDIPHFKDNPLKYIFEKLKYYVEDLYGAWDWKEEEVRIIYWFDN